MLGSLKWSCLCEIVGPLWLRASLGGVCLTQLGFVGDERYEFPRSWGIRDGEN